MADIVDFRAPKAGRSGFAGDGVACDAGDAGIVLNLFFPSATLLEPGLVSVDDRAVRGVVVAAAFRELSPADLSGSLPELTSFLSVADELAPGNRRAVDEAGGLFSTSREAVEGVRDARFAAPDTRGLFVSARGLDGPFCTSSIELVE